MYPSVTINAAPFVYGLLAVGLICGVVVAAYVARDALRERGAGKPRRRKST